MHDIRPAATPPGLCEPTTLLLTLWLIFERCSGMQSHMLLEPNDLYLV